MTKPKVTFGSFAKSPKSVGPSFFFNTYSILVSTCALNTTRFNTKKPCNFQGIVFI